MDSPSIIAEGKEQVYDMKRQAPQHESGIRVIHLDTGAIDS